MSKFITRLLSCVLLVTLAFATVSCKKKDKDNGKAKLYVYSFTSGFGDEWLTSLIADYEEKMKDVVIDGKKGIDVVPTAEQSDVTGSQMAGRQEVIYFLEQQDYYELVGHNYVADITSAITSANPYDTDGKTLESKMFDDQKSYFARTGKDGKAHYYAYPHYFTSFGIVYDVTLFDTKGYYFADGYVLKEGTELSDIFLGTTGVSEGWEKTAGPDGQKGNTDDGLPTTYEEFFLLCDYIAQSSDNPLLWTGQHRRSYLTHFINALATDYEGYEQMRLNYTFDGEAKNLGKAVGGQFVKDETPTQIDGTNGAELARQAGKYYAMSFYNELFNKPYINKEKNVNTVNTLFSSSYSHLKAQEDFLKRTTPENAMLLDGSWWQMEATPIFDILGKDPANSKQNKKVGWMPLPKQNADLVGSKQTMFDIMYPLCVMKNGLDTNSWEYKYALDFIQFANSDEQLAKFTKITGCTKALNYTLTSDQYNSLSYFGKSFYDAYKKADIVFPYDNNLLFANNQKVFSEITGANGCPFYQSTANSESTLPESLEAGTTFENYFNGMYTYFSKLNVWKSSK